MKFSLLEVTIDYITGFYDLSLLSINTNRGYGDRSLFSVAYDLDELFIDLLFFHIKRGN